MQFHFYMVYVTMKGMNDKDASQQLRYRVGIDVGTHSIGFCAVEVDESGMPIQLLNSMVISTIQVLILVEMTLRRLAWQKLG